MKMVKPRRNKPLSLKREYKDLVMEAWDRLHPEDKDAEEQKERERLWAAEEVHRKAKSKL